MNHYYMLSESIDFKKIGLRNGGCQVKFELEGNNKAFKDGYDLFIEKGEISLFEDFSSIITGFKLERKAKLTDFVTFYPINVYCKFLISEKIWLLIKDTNIDYHYTFKCKIKGSKETYFLVILSVVNYDVVDFSTSIFSSGDEFTGETEYLFDSYEEYKKKFDLSEKLIFPKKVFLNDLFKRKDFLYTRFSAYPLVSEKIKSILEKHSATGIEIFKSKSPFVIPAQAGI